MPSEMAIRMNAALEQLRRDAFTEREGPARSRMLDLVDEARRDRRRQRGAAGPSLLGVVVMVAIAVLAGAFFILGAWAIGTALLSRREERELAPDRSVWRQKRRELNASIESRRVR